MNVPIAFTIYLQAFQCDDARDLPVPSSVCVSKAIQTVMTVVSQIPFDSMDYEVAMGTRGGARKKGKAPLFPGIPESDEPLVQMIFCIVGLAILFVLWCVYLYHGGD